MSDPIDRLRNLADAVPPFEADLAAATAAGQRRRTWTSIGAAAGALVAVIAIVGGGIALLSGGEGAVLPATAETTTTTVPASTTPPSTTSAAPTTTSAAPTTTIDPAAAVDPETIVIAEAAENVGVQMEGTGPFTINPFLEPEWRVVNHLDHAIQVGAWRPGPGGDPEADVVVALPHPADGTAIVAGEELELYYRIRDDARWSDGTPVTVDDFVRTLEILQSPDLPIRADWRELHAGVAAIDPATDTEFTVTVSTADSRYRSLFPVVLPAHVVDSATFADAWNDRMWPSAGPFELARFERFDRPRAAQMVLTRNPEQPATRPAPSTIVIDFYQRDERGDSMAIAAFRDGRADVLGPTATWDYLQRFTPPPDVTLVSTQAVVWEILFIQQGDQRLAVNPESRVDDLEVRTAILQSLDRNLLDDLGGSIASLVEFFTGVDNPSGGWAGVPFDPGAAGAALGGDPVPLVYSSTAGDLTVRIGEAVISLLRDAGFAVTADFDQDAQAAFERFNAGDFELFASRLIRTPGSDGLAELLDIFRSDAVRTENFPGFPDVWGDNPAAAEFGRVLDDADRELDPDRRLQLLIAAEDLLVREVAVIPLAMRNGESWVFDANRIAGPTSANGADEFMANIADWVRVDG